MAKKVEVIRSSEKDLWDIRDADSKEVLKTCKEVKLKNVDFISEPLTEETVEKEVGWGCGVSYEQSTEVTEWVGYARGELLDEKVKFKDVPIRVMFDKLKGFFKNYWTEKEISQSANFLHLDGWASSLTHNEVSLVKPTVDPVSTKTAEAVETKVAEKAKSVYVQVKNKEGPTHTYVAVKK